MVRPTDARFCVAFAISVFGFAACAEEASVQPGNYGGLIVGYEPKSNMVSGYFNSETGNGQFTCLFYLKEKFEKNLAKVESYFPGIENDKNFRTIVRPGADPITDLPQETARWMLECMAFRRSDSC